jgi:hypothetical protein
VLCSQDATYDGKTTYTFRNVSVPFEEIKGNCRLFLWNFVFSGTDNPSVAYNINLEKLTQQLSYDSRTWSTAKTLGTSYGFYIEATTADYGISLQDLSLFTQRTMTISFETIQKSDNTELLVGKAADGTTPAMPPWQLTLGIIQTE